ARTDGQTDGGDNHNEPVNSQLTLPTKHKLYVSHETREVMAIAQAMCRLFTFHQLVTCSMKGATTTTGSPSPSLPAAERNAIIDVIAKTFDKPLVDVEEKMRGCLRHLRLMHKYNAYANRCKEEQANSCQRVEMVVAVP
ncbi:hypothetical protein DPMN_058712, partial [Dreissena polymorpha]